MRYPHRALRLRKTRRCQHRHPPRWDHWSPGRHDAPRVLRQFAQRIAIEYHLEALQLEETLAYVRHRIQVAGGHSGLFLPEALQLIHECTAGVPRLVNMMCDTALVYGFAEQRPLIDAQVIHQVLQDRAANGSLTLTSYEARPLNQSLAAS